MSTNFGSSLGEWGEFPRGQRALLTQRYWFLRPDTQHLNEQIMHIIINNEHRLLNNHLGEINH